MITNDKAVAIIKTEEGFRAVPYLCPAGHWTAGFGHTGPEVDRWAAALDTRDPLSLHEADVILHEIDLPRFERAIEKVVTQAINGNQFSALVSFLYNVGPGKKGAKDGLCELKSGGPSSLLRMTNAGLFAAAAEQFAKWVHAGQPPVVLPGLVRRRARERALFLESVH